MLSLLLFILLAKEPASICLVLFVCRIQWDSLCGKGRGRIGMLIGLFAHGLAIKKLLVTLSLSAQCNHRATDKVIITVCAERLKSPLNYAQFKLARALEGVMDKLLLPLRYHCYVVCMITLGGRAINMFLCPRVYSSYAGVYAFQPKWDILWLFLEMKDSYSVCCLYLNTSQASGQYCTVHN